MSFNETRDTGFLLGCLDRLWPRVARTNNDIVREAVRLAVRGHLKRSHGKKPLLDVHLVRV